MLFDLCVSNLGDKLDIKFGRTTFYSILTNDACKHIRVSSNKTDVCDTCDLLPMELNSIAHAGPYAEGMRNSIT